MGRRFSRASSRLGVFGDRSYARMLRELGEGIGFTEMALLFSQEEGPSEDGNRIYWYDNDNQNGCDVEDMSKYLRSDSWTRLAQSTASIFLFLQWGN